MITNAGLDAVNKALKETPGFDNVVASRVDTGDPVVAPNHYMVGGIETIDFIRAKLTQEEFRGFCKGNVIKYLSRAEHKGGSEDYKKARVYIGWLTDVSE